MPRKSTKTTAAAPSHTRRPGPGRKPLPADQRSKVVQVTFPADVIPLLASVRSRSLAASDSAAVVWALRKLAGIMEL